MTDPAAAKVASELRELEKVKWHSLTRAEVFSRVSSQSGGLTTAGVEASLQRWGPNRTPNISAPSIFAKIWGQVNNILIYILIVAAIISGAFLDWPDMCVLFASFAYRTKESHIRCGITSAQPICSARCTAR